MENNEYIERYLYEVGRRLSGKQREDIIKELRSLIQDAIEAKVGKGRTPTQEDISAVLKEMGSPAEVAARYSDWPQYVVGPELFPIYRIFLMVILIVCAFALALAFIVQAVQIGPLGNLWPAVGQLFGGIFSGAFSAVGAVTIVFAIIERVRKQDREKFKSAMDDVKKGFEKGFQKTPHWSPEKMPPVPGKQDKMKYGEVITGIVFSTIAIVLFNIFLNRIGIYYTDVDGVWSFIPVINSTLASYVILWNISWAASIALSSVVLAYGRWNVGTRIADIMLSIFGAIIAIIILAGPSIVPTQFILESWHGSMSIAELQNILQIIEKVVFGILIFAVVMSCVDVGKKIYKLVRTSKG